MKTIHLHHYKFTHTCSICERDTEFVRDVDCFEFSELEQDMLDTLHAYGHEKHICASCKNELNNPTHAH